MVRYVIGRAVCCLTVLWLFAFSSVAQNYPAPKEGTWVARDFRFHNGEVMPELSVHYWTVNQTARDGRLVAGAASDHSCPPLSNALGRFI